MLQDRPYLLASLALISTIFTFGYALHIAE